MPIMGVTHVKDGYQVKVKFFKADIDFDGEDVLEDVKNLMESNINGGPRSLAERVRDGLGVRMFLDHEVLWYEVEALSKNGISWKVTTLDEELENA